MAVSDTDVKQLYQGNASTTAFAIPFAFVSGDISYIKVYLHDYTDTAAQTLTLKTITTHYTLNSATAPTTVTMLSAPTATQRVLIIRAYPNTQTTSFGTGPFLPTDANYGLDRLEYQIQELNEKMSRALLVSKAEALAFSGELAVGLEAGAGVYLKDDMTGFETGPTADEVEAAEGYAADALTSANDSASSASSSAGSASAAASSATAAASSATAAASSASGAAASATTATTQASSATTSATAAAASQSAAATSATNAATSATTATTQATNAATSATNAATSASSASTSATTAMTQATAAAASATASAASATAAASSATAAAASAVTAATLTTPTVTGSRASPSLLTAGGGIAFTGTNYFNMWFVAGNAGAVDISANPQIAAGTNAGQRLMLVGRHDTNTIRLEDGTGLKLKGGSAEVYLFADSTAEFVFDGTNWVQL